MQIAQSSEVVKVCKVHGVLAAIDVFKRKEGGFKCRLCKNNSSKKFRKENSEKIKIYTKINYQVKKGYFKNYREKNKEKIKQVRKAYRDRIIASNPRHNKDKYARLRSDSGRFGRFKAKNVNYKKAGRSALKNWYIKLILMQEGASSENITPSMIHLRRLLIAANRLIKQEKHNVTSSNN